ncbi:MAG: bifunctional hydroxymethylpyrimidine kinase/phosphomethylpyrimidine kinase [Lentisphaeria bacterium]
MKSPHKSLSSIHPVALTIAGSDSGGGAGIQADLQAFRYFSVHGTSAITAVTAQNPNEVTGIYPLTPEAVVAQLDSLFSAFTITVAKTGILFSSEIISAVTEYLQTRDLPALIVDPVMVATSGSRLLAASATEALQKVLLPLATVITPNIPEAEILYGSCINDADTATQATENLAREYDCFVLLKGGHRNEKRALDILSNGAETWQLESPMINSHTTHGTGCMLSSALAANLAQKVDMQTAVKYAKAYVLGCLKKAIRVGPQTYAMLPPTQLAFEEIESARIR